MAHIFTDANFQDEVLNSKIPVVVDFWAEWCAPCRVMSPIMDQLAEEIEESKLKIGKINITDNQVFPGKFGVMSLPTFLVFKGGQVVGHMVGSMPKEAMREKLKEYSA